jgi:FtsZ-interacting cell division protein ZipA
MEKKKIYIIVGVVAVLGIGYYLWNKSKKSTEGKEATDDTKTDEAKEDTATDTAVKKSDVSASKPALANAPAPAPKPAPKKLTPQELESKLQSGCGKKPLLKKNKVKYDQCRADLTAKLKSQGLVAFDGSYYFEGLAEMYQENQIREKSFAEQVINREDGRIFAGNVYDN